MILLHGKLLANKERGAKCKPQETRKIGQDQKE